MAVVRINHSFSYMEWIIKKKLKAFGDKQTLVFIVSATQKMDQGSILKKAGCFTM